MGHPANPRDAQPNLRDLARAVRFPDRDPVIELRPDPREATLNEAAAVARLQRELVAAERARSELASEVDALKREVESLAGSRDHLAKLLETERDGRLRLLRERTDTLDVLGSVEFDGWLPTIAEQALARNGRVVAAIAVGAVLIGVLVTGVLATWWGNA